MKTTIIATAALLFATPVWAGQERGQPTGQTQGQGQGQSQGQGQGQQQRATSRSTASGGNSRVTVTQSAGGSGGGYSARGNTPDVVLPGVGGGHPCGLGGGAGGSGMGVGAALGLMWPGRGCEIREKSRLLYNMGNKQAAHEEACLDDDLRRALFSAGTPCARDWKGWDR